MKNLISFLIFIIYTTSIFFIPNSIYLIIFLVINIFLSLIIKVNFKNMLINILRLLPFVVFTFFINWILDDIINAVWIGVKLLLVCNVTYIYSRTISVAQFANTIKLLCSPLQVFKINTEEIKVLVSISLSMIPVLKKEILELKTSCKAKGIEINIKNTKIILYKFFISLLNRVNQIDESLNEKGYNF